MTVWLLTKEGAPPSGDLDDQGMVLEPAIKYQHIAQEKGLPRDNH